MNSEYEQAKRFKKVLEAVLPENEIAIVTGAFAEELIWQALNRADAFSPRRAAKLMALCHNGHQETGRNYEDTFLIPSTQKVVNIFRRYPA